ncbi:MULTISPECIES: 3-oxoadipate enol-lactonase [Lelliottia]|uniref:3-oxoadipate enol-lactonase n=1 Tax=Lelliottia aquatilis TaxID=2080838 RepID=A0ABX5A806_9ENTR|nr:MULTISPECIES: 3-oxoadipate enol-lactonase [Lelliottia]NTZ44303.1 3-oxoadipate enol-lactonase [Lelliottia aquatilis]POZ27270.1 3-oxoadipate enol-lactonase [Lelliottia aquatilis]POZ34024.1 3-oxoadipate enol-lactonase [Lelliottia aquatilis]POZ34558.1 3-oxoadipate enol-lactonase [Lelliottia sp. 7254-16]POZ35092.1 3-oxoadipate enol-lactonase [Lelliottia aquatilis]
MEIEFRLDGPEGAPLLVLSNSLGTTWAMWQAQIPALTQHFRVLRYNTRGHGRSAVGQQPVTLERLGQDVIALLDHLDVERACFCGISLGGMTGMWLNRHAPERFQRIVVANTAARIGQEAGWRDRAATVREQGMDPVAQSAADRWFTPAFRQNNPEVVYPLIEQLAATPAEGYAACCDALAMADLRDELTQMPRPMLVIAGESDPVTTSRDAEAIVVDAPHAHYLVLPASHLSNVACAAAFNQHVITFLTAGAEHELNH